MLGRAARAAPREQEPQPPKYRALALAAKGLYIIPLCWPDQEGQCACPKHHTGHDIGKAPLTSRGVNDSSQSVREIWDWWDKWPNANIGVDLDRSGLIAIAPDSPEWADIFKERGLPYTAVVQSGGGQGHLHHYYRRPKETPLININISDCYDIQPRGYVVAAGSLHQSGRTYEWESDYEWRDVEDLPFVPEWALEEIRQRWEAHSASPGLDVDFEATQFDPGLIEGVVEEWWNGERAATHDDGTTDRSLTLFIIAKFLAKQGATPEEIVSALRDRDEALGFRHCPEGNGTAGRDTPRG